MTRVVAGVLEDGRGRVLIAQRPAGKHLAGYWEFPGGKLADGESAAQALTRELAEELGVRVQGCQAWLRLRHAYPDRLIELAVYLVTRWSGEPTGLEGQALRWVMPQELHAQPLLPADAPIVAALVDRARGAQDSRIEANGSMR